MTKPRRNPTDRVARIRLSKELNTMKKLYEELISDNKRLKEQIEYWRVKYYILKEGLKNNSIPQKDTK